MNVCMDCRQRRRGAGNDGDACATAYETFGVVGMTQVPDPEEFAWDMAASTGCQCRTCKGRDECGVTE